MPKEPGLRWSFSVFEKVLLALIALALLVLKHFQRCKTLHNPGRTCHLPGLIYNLMRNHPDCQPISCRFVDAPVPNCYSRRVPRFPAVVRVVLRLRRLEGFAGACCTRRCPSQKA